MKQIPVCVSTYIVVDIRCIPVFLRELRIPNSVLSPALRAKVLINDAKPLSTVLCQVRCPVKYFVQHMRTCLAVVVHHGELTTGGHYACFVRDPFGAIRAYAPSNRVALYTLLLAAIFRFTTSVTEMISAKQRCLRFVLLPETTPKAVR
jgi:hypothetical protein